jgi:hypothetical protein
MRHLEILLAEVLDFAGLFPPAKLELPEALRAFETHRQGLEKPLLGRFVIPANRLKDLPDLIVDPLPLSVIGHEGPWPEARALDAEAMNAHLDRLGDNAPIEAFEVKLPDSSEPIQAQWLADLERFGADETFVELPLNHLEHLAESLATLAETEALFAKARLSPAPDTSGVATFLQGCLQLDLPFKLTAGIHQPFYHQTGHGPEFGFLTLLSASALVLREDLTRRELEEALLDTEGWSFQAGVHWRGHSADLIAMEEARDLFLSFGSCSVEEPASALRNLGLWPF